MSVALEQTVAFAEFRGTERFVLLRRLGAGGMGVVYEAMDRERQTRIALKALRAFDENALYRFKNEFRALADVRHPNLVRLGELHREGEHWFFTMELVEGTSLLEYVWGKPAAEHDLPTNADTVRGAARTSSRTMRPRKRFDERRLR